MNPLIKVMLTLALIFASTFFIVKLTGILTIEKIEWLFSSAQNLSPWYIGAVVVALLFADLFIAVPTLSTIILAGFFLGHFNGFIASMFGLYLSGIIGYILSKRYGEKLLSLIIKEQEKQQARENFNHHGFATIVLSRALPILPEVSACMSGITKMPFLKFLLAWSISSIPYALIATYAGSISTLNNPKPAIYTMLGLAAFLWLCWFFYQKRQRLMNQR